jgi:signal transduction histidine kinase
MSRMETIIADGSRPAAVPSAAIPSVPISGVVHDLGNLIQIAASALNIISRSPETASGSTLAPVVARASVSLQRAAALVQQTIHLAREGSATVEAVSVMACLMEVQALVRSTWEPAVRFEVQASADLPRVTCSRVSLQSALMNLLFNARDAMPNGGVISMGAATIGNERAASEIEIRVADNGLGMTRDAMLRAFEPFFTTKATGLGGLGLPMVKRFAEEAGGGVDIESEPGVGTTVILRLPGSRSRA